MIKFQFLILTVVVFGLFGTAYAQPLTDVTTTVLNSDGSTASVQFTWNSDDSVSSYEVGCVSCIPNMSKNTTSDTIVLDGVTALDNGTALLYVIAYDENNEINTAKQIVVDLHS